MGVYGESANSYAGDFAGPVRIAGDVELTNSGKVKFPNSMVTSYSLDGSVAGTRQTTAVHSFCAIGRMEIKNETEGSTKSCQAVPNVDGTWGLLAWSSSVVSPMLNCLFYCF